MKRSVFGWYAEEEGRVETINDYNGKTIAKMQFDGGETLCITFTDDTVLVIKERMQAGQIEFWKEDEE